MPRIKVSSRALRDATLFLGGFAGLINEIFLRVGPERPTILMACLAMVGLTGVLRADEKRDKKKEEET